MLHQHQEYWQKVQDTLPSEITIMNKVKICKIARKNLYDVNKDWYRFSGSAGINL